jgi:Protein of unknown function DUF262/Protein of unknown function (DUF1524)
MSKTLFEPGSPTFNELVGNGRMHYVPKYQRDYSWDTEDWDDLWSDIEGIPDEQIHYMGYVVLQRTDDTRRLFVIDGQQRITTLSILALAVIYTLETWIKEGIDPSDNQRRVQLLERNFIAVETAASLTPVSKLHLNRNNDDFYKSFLLRRRRPGNTSKLKPSEKKLWRAFEFFTTKIAAQFDAAKNGQAIADFLEQTVGDKLVFSSITVGDDINAYKVFETLNARGVKLSTGDLLKNYLFAEVARYSEHDLEEAERMWQNINDALQRIDLPTFIRHYWNSNYPLATKTTLFKAIKTEIKGHVAVFQLLQDLETLASVYADFGNPGSVLWRKGEDVSIEELDMFSATQCYTLMLSAYKHIRPVAPEEFTKILRDLVVVTFRYTTISQYNTNIVEQEFNKTAIGIARKQIKTAREVFKSYEKLLYLSDDTFASNFAYRTINTNRYKTLTRYILVKLEQQLGNHRINWNDSEVTIEHILPENAGVDWEVFFLVDEQEESKFRIGNLSLLEPSLNKAAANHPMSVKIDIYRRSVYALSNAKSLYEEWKPATLHKRSKELANLAKTVWKVAY